MALHESDEVCKVGEFGNPGNCQNCPTGKYAPEKNMLESTIVCVDNSEFSRNGDFTPSRLGAQQDVLQTISRAKMRQNPENNVGLLAVGGSKPRLVNTLTSDTNNLLTGFATIVHDGEKNNFSTSLRIAHLSLKHRTSKNYRQRIVIMVCSPLQETEQELVKLAKKLKKENVNVDIVNFGEDEQNVELLAKFIEVLNGKNQDPQCNLVNVPAGSNLNDGVRLSKICGNENAGGAGGMDVGGGMGGEEDWMDDPNMDPDLALALRVSLEESRARQQQEAQASQPNVPSTIQESSATQQEANDTTTVQNNEEALNAMDNDDEMLMQALQMSLADGANNEESAATAAAEPAAAEEEEIDYANMTEEQQIEYALKMSLQQDENNDDKDDMQE